MLKNFDYSQNGWYFVTICTKNRECLFGEIVDNKMVLNKYGEIVNHCWLDIQKHYNNVELDVFQTMPNHIHGIIIIQNSNQSVGNDPCVVPTNNYQVGHGDPTLQNNIRQQQLLCRIIKCFKTITTKKYIDGVNNNQFPRFDKQIWQRSFYDHIIRNENSLFKIRQYIRDNPQNWDKDRNNQALFINKKQSVWKVAAGAGFVATRP